MLEAVGRKWTARLRGVPARLRRPGLYAKWAFQGGVLLVLSASRMAGELSPFAAACFAAGLACAWTPAAMLAGCLCYALLVGWTGQAVCTLAGCAALWAAEGVIRLVDRRGRLGSASVRDVKAAFEAFFAVLIPGVALSGALIYNLVTAFLSAAVASLLAPALISGLCVTARRKTLTAEEQLSLCLLLAMLLIGLGTLPVFGSVAAQAAAVCLTLVFASQGAAQGAMAGIACSAALALGSGVASAGSALGLSGLLAGCVSMLPRPAAALALALGNGLALTYGIGYTLGAVDVLPLILGAAAYCALPAPWIARAGRLMTRAKPRCDAERLAMRLRRDSGAQLERMNKAFETLAEGYAATEAMPDEGETIALMRGRMCAGCQDYEKCWRGDHPEAGRLMCRLLSEAVCQGEARPLGERSPELVRHCRRSVQMDRRLQPLLTELAARCRADRERGDMKKVASNQFHQAALVLGELGGKLKRPVTMRPDIAPLAAAALDKADCRAAQVGAYEENGLEICAALKEGGWDTNRARTAARSLSEELGVKMRPVLTRAGLGDCEIRFVQSAALTARAGISLMPEKGGPCGDTAYVGLLPDGRLMAVLSDGMGSGDKAAEESRRTVRFIRTFLEAGMDSAPSLEAVNALLQARGSGELFATVDLCVADLRQGEVLLSKLGACSSLLLSGGRATELPGGHLPIGILEKIAPGEQSVSVRPGDVLVMYSDGIVDDLQEDHREWLCGKALECGACAPEDMALSLRQAALMRRGGVPKDDMSVIVLRFEEARLQEEGA